MIESTYWHTLSISLVTFRPIHTAPSIYFFLSYSKLIFIVSSFLTLSFRLSFSTSKTFFYCYIDVTIYNVLSISSTPIGAFFYLSLIAWVLESSVLVF